MEDSCAHAARTCRRSEGAEAATPQAMPSRLPGASSEKGACHVDRSTTAVAPPWRSFRYYSTTLKVCGAARLGAGRVSWEGSRLATLDEEPVEQSVECCWLKTRWM